MFGSNDKNWGQCKSCKMWQIEPDAEIAEDTMGVCVAEKLTKYQLRVSGGSGCNIYKSGEVQRVEGSSALEPDEAILVPPTKK